jgi:hypothetical protein
MKMDAMQKQKMWTVAIAHFLLTLFAFVEFGLPFIKADPYESEIWINGWGGFWDKVCCLLQPLGGLIGIFRVLLRTNGFGDSSTILSILLGLKIISIPAWSICFGRLYVKFTNWLNHYPVLGKKVF